MDPASDIIAVRFPLKIEHVQIRSKIKNRAEFFLINCHQVTSPCGIVIKFLINCIFSTIIIKGKNFNG